MQHRPCAAPSRARAARPPPEKKKKKKKEKRKKFSSGPQGTGNIFLKHPTRRTKSSSLGRLPSDELGGLMLSVVFGKPETPRRHVAQRADGQAGGPEERQIFKPSPKLLTPRVELRSSSRALSQSPRVELRSSSRALNCSSSRAFNCSSSRASSHFRFEPRVILESLLESSS